MRQLASNLLLLAGGVVLGLLLSLPFYAKAIQRANDEATSYRIRWHLCMESGGAPLKVTR